MDTDDCGSEQTAGKWLLAFLWRKKDYQAWSIYQAAGKLTCLLNRVVGAFFFFFHSDEEGVRIHTAGCWKGTAFQPSNSSPA